MPFCCRSVRLLPILACFLAFSVHAQQGKQGSDELSGPDRHEHVPEDQGHLLGGWHGERQRLLEHGVSLDLEYISDSLWNVRSLQKQRLASFNRVRGTVDVDFSKLTHTPGLFFHITAPWQAGANLGTYLGTIAGPSGLASENTFRLDSWWFEQRVLHQHVVFRLGQFAAQDFYGAQHYGGSFIAEPLDYALGNLNATYETFDPPSTPAAELRVMPLKHMFVKSMVYAADRAPYQHNPTGLVPQFRGAASSASEIGWSPGLPATAVRAYDTIAQRKGYSGLYQLGSAYNPGKFQSTGPVKTVSGNYLVYLMGSQAVWRTAPHSGVGVDLTAATDWTPSHRSRVPRQTTVGVRFDEPLPLRQHNTIAFGYVRSSPSDSFPAERAGASDRAEDVLELNVLVEVTPFVTLQPVAQRFLNVGGTSKPATVCGFRSKVDF